MNDKYKSSAINEFLELATADEAERRAIPRATLDILSDMRAEIDEIHKESKADSEKQNLIAKITLVISLLTLITTIAGIVLSVAI